MAFTPQLLPASLLHRPPGPSSGSSSSSAPWTRQYEVEITTQADCFVALSHSDLLTSNPAYVRAILRSYVQSKIERKTTLVQSPAGWVQKVNLWEVGKKLDALEKVLIKQGFVNFALQILQTRANFSIPVTDPTLPSSRNPSMVDPNPGSGPPTSTSAPSTSNESLRYRIAQRRASTAGVSISNGTVRLAPRRATVSSTQGNMEGVDLDRAGVIRPSTAWERGTTQDEGEQLPTYRSMREDAESLPDYVERRGEAPGHVAQSVVTDRTRRTVFTDRQIAQAIPYERRVGNLL